MTNNRLELLLLSISEKRTVHSLDKALDNCTKHYCPDTFDKSI